MRTHPRRKALLAAALLAASLAAAPTCAATLEFELQGTNPGGNGSYAGTVSLTETGFGPNGEKSGIVTWRVDKSAPITGIALSTPDAPARISMSFPNRPVPGVALGTLMPDGSLTLVWYIGGRAAGTERWTPTNR